MIALKTLVAHTDALMEPGRFTDYCPNGLQVQGKEEVDHIITGVSASLDLIGAAIDRHADAILVHHGWFWKGEDPRLIGMKGNRVRLLIQYGISLIAYHLPLDAHPEIGNNARFAARLGITTTGPLEPGNPRSIGNIGTLAQPMYGKALATHITERLGRAPLYIARSHRPIRTIAWCTGAAQEYIEQAIAQGVDAFITGEASEYTTHIARENDIHFYAAGHHATERYGIQALGERLAGELPVTVTFVDIDNPV